MCNWSGASDVPVCLPRLRRLSTGLYSVLLTFPVVVFSFKRNTLYLKEKTVGRKLKEEAIDRAFLEK